MKIYIVKHQYDNGESYEDYREYSDYNYYSTLKKASTFFWNKVADEYEGKYQLIEWELDTQDQRVLEESPWITCTPCYWVPDEYCDCETEQDFTPDPMASIEEYWRWEDPCDEWIDYEWEIEQEYLTSENTNFKEWKECEREIQERKSQALFEELNKLLSELITP